MVDVRSDSPFPVPKLCLGTLTPEALLPIREAELPPSRVPKQSLGTRERLSTEYVARPVAATKSLR
uniref:Uncharacterized protein n=1 Tax=Candidatus Kentrum sp. DK TaxID=2126562 RepID=A0A450SZH2_9GAMM|nr:MAG: hypothetical protein BECKDK2373B_GA0170837_10685 [Candidatus Kentron sp. DK]VFJ59476.1 MAG: hypothetical protein BECKDK2373C_GA0170839_107138 [Candidatus Kentron sp. DK]